MCLSLVPAAAFADKPVYKVVAVGDSTCVGVGLDDFGVYTLTDATTSLGECYYYTGTYGLGLLDYGSKDAYPARLARYLQEKMPDRKVQFTNLGISGIRANEILAIIDPTYELDQTGKDAMRYFKHMLEPVCCEPLTGLDLTTLFNQEIKSADLITLDCVMNSFTDCLISRVTSIMSGDPEEIELYSDSVSDIADRVSPGAKKLIDGFVESFKKSTGLVLPQNTATQVTDALAYSYLDFCVNFSLLVDKIRELNPDAKLLVGGGYSPLNFLKLQYNGAVIDVGSLCSAFMGIVNAYMTGVAPQRDEYTFLDIPLNIETFRDYMAKADSVWDFSPMFLNRLIDDSFGTDHGSIATPLCTRARAEAKAQGLDITDYYPIYPAMMFDYYEDVRQNGENAGEVNKIIVGLFNRAFDLMINSMKMTAIDVEAGLEVLSYPKVNTYAVLLKYVDKNFDELTPAEQTEIFMSVVLQPRDGMMLHFSYDGCALKYELAVKALEEGGNKLMQTENILDSARQNVKNGILSSLTSVLKNVLASIDFADFFASIAENIHQFFVRLLPTC